MAEAGAAAALQLTFMLSLCKIWEVGSSSFLFWHVTVVTGSCC